MKNLVRVFLVEILCMALLTGTTMISFAEFDREDSEASLRWLLSDELQTEDFELFEYGDYDNDGIFEAFVLVGDHNSEMWSGDLWFVSPLFCEPVQRDLAYYKLGKLGNTAPILFSAEEWYGGSGSTTYLWSVIDSTPVVVGKDIYGDFEVGEGNEFYSYPSAFDAYSDGTGHTWKQYYYYLDGLDMREYGGIYITRDQLMLFNGADEIVRNKEAEGFALVDIIYRANGIINLNFQETGSHFLKTNDNITIRYEGASVTVWKEDSGVYALASDPARAVYPEAFVAPAAKTSEEDAFDAWMNGSDASDSFGMWTFVTPEAWENNTPVSTPIPTPVSTPVPTVAPTAEPNQTVRIVGDVNVRTGPGLDYGKMGAVSAGGVLKYLNANQTDNRNVVWYKVEFQGLEGWVSSKYAIVGNYTAAPSSSSSSQSSSSSSYGYVKATSHKVNLRDVPNINGEDIGTMDKGETATYLGKKSTDSRGVTWYKVRFAGKTGWVSSRYTKLYR